MRKSVLSLAVRAGLAAGAALAVAAPASATLLLEPVFNAYPGTGPADNVVGLYLPDFINPATGEPFLTADRPGMIVTYPAGYPADPLLADTLRFYNNTKYVITGFTLSLVGTALEPEPFNFTVVRDPNVDAFFDDANGDGFVGLSDIFPMVEILNEGRTIRFSGGSIPVGGRFTDYNFATTTDGEPFLAAIDASFEGYVVPEPPAWAMLMAGFGAIGLAARRRRGLSVRASV
jgi:hypothetical protein